MSRLGFLRNIALTGDVPRVRTAMRYNLKQTEFITHYQEYLKMHGQITFETLTLQQQKHLVVLMLFFSNQTTFSDQCHRYKKAKNVMIHRIQNGEFPTFDNVLSVGLRFEEFERAFMKWGKPNNEYTTLKQHYQSMQNAEVLAIEECKKIFDLSAKQTLLNQFRDI